MGYSEESYALAQNLLIVSLVKAVDHIAPGVLRVICDKVIEQASAKAEETGEEKYKEVMFLIHEWTESLETGEGHVPDTETSVLHSDADRIQALEGQIAAEGMRLACYMDELDTLKPGASDRSDRVALKNLKKIADGTRTVFSDEALAHMERKMDAVYGRGEFAKKE